MDGMRRRIGAWLAWMVLSLAAVPVPGVAQTFTQAEARAIVEAHIAEQLDYTPAEYEIYSLGFDGDQWGFAAKLQGGPDARDGLIVGSMDDGGALCFIEGPSDVDINTQIQGDLKHSLRDHRQMYRFKMEWAEKLRALMDAGLGDDIRMDHYARVALLDIGLPGEGDVTRDDAMNRARAQLAALPDWSMERVDLFEEIIEVYHTPEDIGRPVFQFVFARRYDEFERESDYARYEEALLEAFGGDNGAAPLYISVIIDARSGELAEAPQMECPPRESHFLDFILR